LDFKQEPNKNIDIKVCMARFWNNLHQKSGKPKQVYFLIEWRGQFKSLYLK